MPTSPLQRNISRWEVELENDEDKQFLLQGIRNGFSILDDEKTHNIKPSFTKNSFSVIRDKDLVDKRINIEIQEGNYVITGTKPIVVSALSSIPKPDGDIRLIHDFSRPKDNSVNDYATVEHFRYQTLSDAINKLSPNSYMAKIDLLSAYRSVGLHPSNHPYTGLQWRGKYMYDTRLPFGARKSPQIFNRITQAVRRMMERRGFNSIIVYLDDFLVIGSSYAECLIAYKTLMSLLRSLGLSINYRKLVEPCQKLVFLGIEINTVVGSIALESTKARNFLQLIDSLLTRRRISRKELEKVTGKLSWASVVIPWGRLHIRPLYNRLTQMKSNNSKCLITHIAESLQWWSEKIVQANGTKLMWDLREEIFALTDASLHAGGAFCNGDWLYTAWLADEPHLESQHINTKELAIIVSAAKRWGPMWANKRIQILTDNVCAMWNINNGTCVNLTSLNLLRELCDLSLKFNFTIHASFISSRDNFIADSISRLHENGQLPRFISVIPGGKPQSLVLNYHMTFKSMFFMSLQIQKWLNWVKNWTRK